MDSFKLELMHIGKFRHEIDVILELEKLSQEDELSASILAQNGHHRQACYLLTQAMEKAIRAKIFTFVNPNNEYFRNQNRTHSLEKVVNFLIELVSTDKTIKSQVLNQINKYVIGVTHYSYLHNNLRYPTYFEKYDSYSLLEISRSDFDLLQERLKALKAFLKDLHKFR